jgi:hypothetical protein
VLPTCSGCLAAPHPVDCMVLLQGACVVCGSQACAPTCGGEHASLAALRARWAGVAGCAALSGQTRPMGWCARARPLCVCACARARVVPAGGTRDSCVCGRMHVCRVENRPAGGGQRAWCCQHRTTALPQATLPIPHRQGPTTRGGADVAGWRGCQVLSVGSGLYQQHS